jgi:hypothetical protein
VRTGNFGPVRIPVRRTVEVQPHEDNRLPRPILVCGLSKLDLRAGHTEHEILAFVEGY